MSNFQLSEKKLYKPFSNDLEKPDIIFFIKNILSPEKNLLIYAAIYGIIISLLSLAIPVLIQLLINSVLFTAILQPIIILGVILLILLTLSGVFNSIQFYVAEIFQRKIFARLASEISLKLLYADHRSFQESNQTELANRFFDVITIQKTIPKFLTKTFTVILQSILGLILISCYHPILLLFSLLIVISIYFICKIYIKNAIISSFFESRKKYDLAGWLEDIARNNVIFKSEVGQNYAKYKIDFITNQYLKERKKHFKSLFSQNILLLALYAIASSALLILGGYLVLKSQLTLGQLVASELVLSSILYGISRLGSDFESFYDMVGACEKLTNFYNIPLNEKRGEILDADKINIKFDNVKESSFGKDYIFNFEFKSGKNYLLTTKHSSTQKLIIELINGLHLPQSGNIEFNEINIENLDCFDLRSKISIIDNSQLLEGTIEEYLTFHDQKITRKQVNEILKITGLDLVISRFEEGLSTRIIPSGWPFSESEKILLKTARTLLLQPKIIIITEIFDILSLKMRKKIMNYLTKEHYSTIICFSNRRDEIDEFDSYGFINYEKMTNFSSIKDLQEFEQNL